MSKYLQVIGPLKGEDGKSAYQYAQDGGYTGTEAEFAEKLAAEGDTYTLPIASSTQLGGVQPAAKTDAMTQAVGVDEAGALWTEPGSGGGGTKEEIKIEMELSEEASVLEADLTDEQRELLKTVTEIYAYAYVVRPSKGSTESTGLQNVQLGLKHPNYFSWQIFSGKVVPTPAITYSGYCKINLSGRPVIDADGLSYLYAQAKGTPQNAASTMYNTEFFGSLYSHYATFRLQCDIPMGVGTKAVLIARR